MSASALARGAPTQRWMPWPKARWPTASRSRSSRSGDGNRSGSRFAAPRAISTGTPAGISLPPSVTASVVYRKVAVPTGESKRSNSSSTAGTSSGLPRRRSSSAGCRSRARAALPRKLVVVSCPATSSSTDRETNSRSLNRSVPSRVAMRRSSSAPPGRRRLAATRSVMYSATACDAASIRSGLPAANSSPDQCWTSARSASGTPSSSQITMTGRGTARSATKSTCLPTGHRSSSVSVTLAMNGRSSATAPVVNVLVTSLRRRVCCGGSLASMWCATAGCRRRRDSLSAKKAAVFLESRGSPSACRASA